MCVQRETVCLVGGVIYLSVSFGCDAKLNSLLALLFCDFTEEGNFLFVGGFPLIIAFECAFKMGFNVYIEGLGL